MPRPDTSPAMEADARTVPCERCDAGWIEDYPVPTPEGPHYSYSRCSACDGTGYIEIELAPIEQDDLPNEPDGEW